MRLSFLLFSLLFLFLHFSRFPSFFFFPLFSRLRLSTFATLSIFPCRLQVLLSVICLGCHPSQTNQQMQCVYRCFLDKLRSRHRRLEDCSISQIVRHVAPIKNELREKCRFVQFNRGANSLSESTCSSNEKRKWKIRLLLFTVFIFMFIQCNFSIEWEYSEGHIANLWLRVHCMLRSYDQSPLLCVSGATV